MTPIFRKFLKSSAQNGTGNFVTEKKNIYSETTILFG